mgnify:CR=1 FL=1|jgi:hypothetical protein
MKYLCLIYRNEESMERSTSQERGTMTEEYFNFTQDIKNSGHLLGGEALQPTSTATIVRVRNGKVSTTDGPFIETKEQLGGFYLIEGKDLNDAIQVASRIPGAKTGAIEVRPIQVFSNGM